MTLLLGLGVAEASRNMRVGVLGRTHILIRAAHAIADRGHEISFVHTCAPEAYYAAGESDFARLADELGAPLLTEPRLARALGRWQETETDVCVSLNWPTLIPGSLLTFFPHGILNAHAGDLPRYRGNACANWAIINFEERVGLTIHLMTVQLDAGPWLAKASLPIDENTYIGDIYDWLEAAIPEAFCEALERIITCGPVNQDALVRPLRTFPRRPTDSRINWSADTRNILALIRASSRPFEGASTTLEGSEIIRIFRACAYVPDFDFFAVPGQVCIRLGCAPAIATGDGMIEVKECESEGRSSAETMALIASSLRNRLV